MNIRIKATAIALTPELRGMIEKKLESIGRFLEHDPSATCDVEVGKTTGHHKHGDIFRAEIHIVAARRDIYVASEQNDLNMALDNARDEALHRLSSDKGKRLSRLRRGGRAVKDMLKGFWKGNR